MNKKSFITALLAIVSLTTGAQEKLIRIDNENTPIISTF